MGTDRDGINFCAKAGVTEVGKDQSVKARTPAVTLHEWQEEERLGRFFGKLLGEAAFLSADRVDFSLDQDVVSGRICKEGRALKSLTVKPVWLPLMRGWLARREDPTKMQKGGVPLRGTKCSVRVGDYFMSFLLSCEAKRNVITSLNLSEFVQQSVDQFYEQFVGDAQSSVYLERVFSVNNGSIVVCAPPGEEAARRIGLVLIASGAGYLGDVRDTGTREVLQQIASQQRTVVSISAEDPTEALLQLRASGIFGAEIGLRGCVSGACIKAVCRACAKTAYIDPSVKTAVPDYLQKLSMERYVVGRGCDACGNQGYDGALAVFSVLVATPQVTASGSIVGDIDIVRALAPQGLRPLFEEAYRRAAEGRSTIEAVLRAVKPPLPVYSEFWKERTMPPTPRRTTTEEYTEAFESGSAPLFPTTQPAPRPKRERPLVLVVEDDDDQRAILELVLKGAEYDVQQACNGAEALKVVEATTPDIIVSDLMMPVMDGSQMVTCLKKDAATSQVPILMLTMIDDAEREYALLDLGADDYCAKTIQRKVLLKRVENLLRRAHSGR